MVPELPYLSYRIAASPRQGCPVVLAFVLACGAAAVLAGSTAVTAASGPSRAPGADRVAGLARLPGHVNGHARPQFDTGPAPDSLVMNGLEIVFAKSPAQQRALEQLIAAQQDPRSPQYHRWLTPAEYGVRFGASEATVAAVTQWLEGNGFSVDALPANRSQLRFHGTKAQVEAALNTEIHSFVVGGVRHFASVSDPEVPAALAPAITVIRGLHDFHPRASFKSRPARAAGSNAQPQITYDGGKQNYVGPGDFVVMYNLQPLYNHSVNGKGVTIAIAAQSDIDPTVAAAYWSGVGIVPAPTFSSIPVPTGTDPGKTGNSNEGEAYLDVEVAGALAPGAKILLVRDVAVTTAFQHVIQHNLAAVLNISFSDCESDLGANNAAINSLFQEAAAQGITITVSSGDTGVAGCDSTPYKQGQLATTGFAVNGLASTPYDLAVGGTDFDPTQPQNWSTTNAPGTQANALAHIPEMVWNDTCANPLIAQALATTPSALCNQALLNGQPNPFLEVAGSGGGVSSCLSFVNTNMCQGTYGLPAWQTGVNGLPQLLVRALPDVAVIASGWVVCSYDVVCNVPADGVDIVEGTSAAAPAVAAIVALLDQATATVAVPDGRQGLVNPQFYKLAAAEYGTAQAPNAAAAACNASLGPTIGAKCFFYNVTAGGNQTPCQVSGYTSVGSAPSSTCDAPAGQSNGIISISSTPEWVAGTGFSLATGLGSINAFNLVFAISLPPPSGFAATTSATSINLSWTADPQATSYDLYEAAQSGHESTPVQSAIKGTSTTFAGQFGQTYYFTLTAQSVLGTSGSSSEVKATVVPAAPTLTASAGNTSVTLTWTASAGATSYDVYQGTGGTVGASPTQRGITGLTTTVSNLANKKTYDFVVVAVNVGGLSAPSNQVQATPLAPAERAGGGAMGALELTILALLVALEIIGVDRGRVRAPSPISGMRKRPADDL